MQSDIGLSLLKSFEWNHYQKRSSFLLDIINIVHDQYLEHLDFMFQISTLQLEHLDLHLFIIYQLAYVNSLVVLELAIDPYIIVNKHHILNDQ